MWSKRFKIYNIFLLLLFLLFFIKSYFTLYVSIKVHVYWKILYHIGTALEDYLYITGMRISLLTPRWFSIMFKGRKKIRYLALNNIQSFESYLNVYIPNQYPYFIYTFIVTLGALDKPVLSGTAIHSVQYSEQHHVHTAVTGNWSCLQSMCQLRYAASSFAPRQWPRQLHCNIIVYEQACVPATLWRTQVVQALESMSVLGKPVHISMVCILYTCTNNHKRSKCMFTLLFL